MREIQFREALREAMNEEMRKDPKIFLMGEEVAEYNGAYKVSQGMLDEFGPERVIDTPIAESQHSQNFENWFANTPGLKVVVPSNPYDAKGLLKSSIRDDDPVIFMESELMYGDKGEVPESEYLIPLGTAKVVKEGNDVTIVSFGKMMKVAFEAADALQQEGVSAEIIDLMSVRPIDYDTVVNSVKKTNRLVIVEEAWPLASIASEITYHIQRYAFDYLDAPVRRVTNLDVPLPYAPTLIEFILPNAKKTIDAVNAVMYR